MGVDIQKRNRRQYAWQKENKDRINFNLPKGCKQVINETAKANGMTASDLIRAAIHDKLNEYGVDTSSLF